MSDWAYGTLRCVGWQVTLCDPIWQVTLRGFEVGRAIPFNRTNQRVSGENGDVDKPEVDEEEDLFVEQVDRQDALDVVTMDGTQTTHLQVTHCDPRETHRRRGRGCRTRRPIAANLCTMSILILSVFVIPKAGLPLNYTYM